MNPILLLALGGVALYYFVSGTKAPGAGFVGPTAGQELPSLALGAYRQPWPAGTDPSMLQVAIDAYRAAGVEPTGLAAFGAEWNATDDLNRSRYGMAAQSANAQTMMDVAAAVDASGAHNLAAGLILVARFYLEGPTPNLLATSDWMARGSDPEAIPTELAA